MTDHERNDLRALQDAILDIVDHTSRYTEDTQVSADMPAGATIGSLRTTIWPGYEWALQDVLDYMQGR